MKQSAAMPRPSGGRSVVTIMLAIGLVLAACGANDTPSPAAPPAPTPAPAPPVETGPTPGGTLVFGQVFPIQNTNPHPQSGNTFNYREALFDTLVALDDAKLPLPWLATAWELSADGLSLTMDLRTDVKFHSGAPFDAAAAAWNIQYAAEPENRVQAGGQIRDVTTEVIGTHRFVMRFESRKPQIWSALIGIPIIDPASDIDTAVGGTGPFRLADFSPGNEMRLVRNADYWVAGLPYLDELVIRVIPDASSLVLGLETGELDVIIQPPMNEARRLEDSGVNIVNLPGPGNFNFLVSTVDEPLNDKRVRQALGLAINRDYFRDVVTFGLSQPTCVVFPPSSPVYSPQQDDCEFDLAKAKALLAEAGYPNGFEFTINIATAAVQEVGQFAEAFQFDLSQIGVKANIEPVETTRWLELITKSEFTGMVGHAYQFGDLDPALLFGAHPFGLDRNASRFDSDRYRTLVRQAAGELNNDRRIQIYREVVDLIKDESFILPIGTRIQLYALGSRVKGFDVNPLNMPDFRSTWLQD